jgi:hypothetical protein
MLVREGRGKILPFTILRQPIERRKNTAIVVIKGNRFPGSTNHALIAEPIKQEIQLLDVMQPKLS